ncbi:PPC domain-containing DNA-binding protein [Chondromyces crocatus]|uniref:PPC domain-containing protein n=1 Tax=Chondromyces crocatus TaxID=52 RepID=A0A0K1EQK3_CHOCO|nr:PPC domain-containing DNA-binding protein [Chondromyces crocatus]AKT43210.1 uncharacterized protein CMC5_074410 [Chondromyces crocatus]
MNVIEARRPRHLIVRVDRGEELPAALTHALDEIEARAGWIQGTGTLEAAELAPADPTTPAQTQSRRIDSPCEVVSLSGSIASQNGVSTARLWATLARESELGLQLAAGELLWARAHSLELLVTAFDDVILARVPDGHSRNTVLAAQTGALSTPATSGYVSMSEVASTPHEGATQLAAEPARRQTPIPTRTVVDPSPAQAAQGPAIPQRLPRQAQQPEEVYPEVGDLVTHFHFGDCEVIESDGERIRLRQERDGRVREVALTMLKIEAPTIDPTTSKHRFKLSRKH